MGHVFTAERVYEKRVYEKQEIVRFDSNGKNQQSYQFRRAYGFDVFKSKIIVSDLKYQTSNWHLKRFSQ